MAVLCSEHPARRAIAQPRRRIGPPSAQPPPRDRSGRHTTAPCSRCGTAPPWLHRGRAGAAHSHAPHAPLALKQHAGGTGVDGARHTGELSRAQQIGTFIIQPPAELFKLPAGRSQRRRRFTTKGSWRGLHHYGFGIIGWSVGSGVTSLENLFSSDSEPEPWCEHRADLDHQVRGRRAHLAPIHTLLPDSGVNAVPWRLGWVPPSLCLQHQAAGTTGEWEKKGRTAEHSVGHRTE